MASNRMSRWQTLFEQLTARERGLVVIAGVLAITMVGYWMVIEPMNQQQQQAAQEAQGYAQRLAATEGQIAAVMTALKNDPNDSERQQQEALLAEQVALKNALYSQTHDLIPAGKMASLLREMLSQSDRVELISLRSLPPTPLLTADTTGGGDQLAVDTNLYQHGVTLTIEGRYTDVQSYLSALESLPWQLYWQAMDYQVTNYPVASVELTVYTLSTQSTFMGVWDEG
ncbi:type II secretion system protein M [Aestuariibacter halophilus]|uniref:Type II secretion system protein M n=1 Tax=Fluctibacter halophilus TaxID=226011 RepID=A0ABS8GCX6_9ALTE|nr:type II secretion system protein GspM [Aestuariibacter halophilus]MCC2617634.1 type II secretion system protein M [Aestuariibacter halophilus]